MASLIAENEQLSNRVAQVNPPQSLPDDQLRELLRLRGEVGVLRQQAKELEAVRTENRQARAALESKTQGAARRRPPPPRIIGRGTRWRLPGMPAPTRRCKLSFGPETMAI